jgi:hypothetical protein
MILKVAINEETNVGYSVTTGVFGGREVRNNESVRSAIGLERNATIRMFSEWINAECSVLYFLFVQHSAEKMKIDWFMRTCLFYITDSCDVFNGLFFLPVLSSSL